MGVENANTRTVDKFLKKFLNDSYMTQQKFISQLVTYIVYWIKWQHKCWNENKEIKTQINYKYGSIVTLMLLRMKRASTTSILSQKNKACNGMNESVKTVISLHCVTPFFPCQMQTTDDR